MNETGLSYSLPPELLRAVDAGLRDWDARDGTARLWRKDATLWTGSGEERWLGWLSVIEDQLAALPELRNAAWDADAAGFDHVVLLGMGGSSLCPEVLAETFGPQPGHPRLLVLDSTDPVQVLSLEERVDLARTLFVVASKSGSTLEPEILRAHFFTRVAKSVGSGEVGSRFVAITDPGSQLHKLAERDSYRRVFLGVPEIGGRFSALSRFGLVPASLMGLDVARLLAGARSLSELCRPGRPAERNPGVALGVLLGIAAQRGLDKLTVFASPGLYDLGAWMEQLVAESTGKHGKAIIPVDREAPALPEAYGDDRIFAYVRLAGAADGAQDAAVARLQAAGRPVLRIDVAEPYALGGEFFRWEIATAVAGALLGINPFDQPDVEAAKVAAREVTAEYERTGALPAESPLAERGGLRLYTDAANAEALRAAGAREGDFAGLLRAHLARPGSGDYFALLAYLPMQSANARPLQAVRHAVRDRRRVATCLGFGPRFLHSTGQAYKGGPNTGVFLQVTCDDARDVPVPGQKLSFGVVKAAQAQGDFEVLAGRGRRALRVHLSGDVAAGLAALEAAVREALA